MNKRMHLKAIVAAWLISRDPVDGANEARELVDTSWEEAYEHTRELVSEGLLEWNDENEANISFHEGSTYSWVLPTGKGILEALS